MGGCRNYGPVLGPYYSTAPDLIFRVPQKGTIILTTAQKGIIPPQKVKGYLLYY